VEGRCHQQDSNELDACDQYVVTARDLFTESREEGWTGQEVKTARACVFSYTGSSQDLLSDFLNFTANLFDRMHINTI